MFRRKEKETLQRRSRWLSSASAPLGFSSAFSRERNTILASDSAGFERVNFTKVDKYSGELSLIDQNAEFLPSAAFSEGAGELANERINLDPASAAEGETSPRASKFSVTFHPQALLKEQTCDQAKSSSSAKVASRPLTVGNAALGGMRPVLIVGPDRFYSAEQVFETARAVHEAGGQFLRIVSPSKSSFKHGELLDERELKLVSAAARAFDLNLIATATQHSEVETLAKYCDGIEVPAEAMEDLDLLAAVGAQRTAAFLHRGSTISLEEFEAQVRLVESQRLATICLVDDGQECLADPSTSLLDVCGVVAMRRKYPHPVVVNCGVIARDWTYVNAIAQAAAAAGAAGVMFEVEAESFAYLGRDGVTLFVEEFSRTARRLTAISIAERAASHVVSSEY